MKRLITVLLLATSFAAAQNHSFTVENGKFLLDGKPFQVLAGEMHYARVPREYWRDRFRKARAMGLNTITTYVFWNLHEPRPGVYDFHGQLDVAEFVREAQQEGLWVILRPGPYVCSEWDLGGLPAWLLADPDMQLRSKDARFLRPAAAYLQRLGRELAPLLVTRGGPIIMVQVENEYGSFGDDHDYMRAVRDAIVAAGFDHVVLETADGPSQFARGSLPGLPVVANFSPGGAEKAFAAIDRFRPGNPHMAGEWWAGWFDQWGEPHQHTDAAKEGKDMEWMLAHGASFSIYMWHGGTTFGFMNGANWEDKKGYRPQTTSYDYDAALDEAGRVTKKYHMFREVIARHSAQPLPEIPAPQPVIAVPPFELRQVSSLWDNLPNPISSEAPRTMEAVGQSYGYIAYGTAIGGRGELEFEPRDYAQVYVDGALAGTLDRRLQQTKLSVTCGKRDCELVILVENTGRINFGQELRQDRKGIPGAVTFAGRELKNWQITPLPMEDVSRMAQPSHRSVAGGPGTSASSGPAFYRGTFTLSALGDTFLDMRGWGKGQVWVNGHNLGRFWSIGPQQTVYVPAPWLKKGANEVIVFDLERPRTPTLRGLQDPVLDEVH